MEHHEVFAYCVTFLQVAIALSAVAALTKQKLVWYFSMLVGLAGILYFSNGFLKAAHKSEEKPAETRSEHVKPSGEAKEPPGKG